MSSRCARLVRTLVFVLVVLFGLLSNALDPSRHPLITQPVNENQRTILKGNTHPLARSESDRGVAPPDLPMQRMLLVLKRSPEQERSLHKLLDDQQDKASASYHQWLTPERFGQQFGPTDQDMQVVTGWLQSHGFQIGNITKGRTVIEFSGTAAQVQEALHTSIHRYVVDGEEHWANASDPQIPSALVPVVAGVHTLHNFVKKPLLHMAPDKVEAKYAPDKPPHVTFPTTPPLHALGPQDYAVIYNVDISGGAFASVAVVARSNLFGNGQDVDDFYSVFGLSTPRLNIVLNGPDPGDLGGGEEGEATLDATWAGAIATGATVDFVVSATTNTTDGVDLSEVYIIDNNLADVMTESFGACESFYTSTEASGISSLAEQAAAQGITYLVAAGDSGAEGCDDPNSETTASGPLSVNMLASSPFTVAVGGTMFNEGQSTKYWSSSTSSLETAVSYIPENVWNESCTVASCGQNAGIWAGSGGASAFFTKPSWQTGVSGIPSDGARDLPDVSLTAASHDAYLLCLEGSCEPDSQGNFFVYLVGGTSASTPAFAGIMAQVNTKMLSRQGQANYVLYKLAAAETLSKCNGSNTVTLPASTCVFNDVTSGNNAVPGEVGYGTGTAKYQTGAGYDLATGLGSVNVNNLLNAWNTVTFTPTTTTLSISPTTGITHGSAANVTIGVTRNSGSGTPSGDVALLVDTGTPPQPGVGRFTLSGGSVSASMSSLPGGTYPLIAHYAGDATFGASDSAPVTVTVSPESSNVSLSVLNLSAGPFTTGSYGTFVYLRADVSGQSGQGTPTGTVSFLDGTSNVSGDPYALNSEGNTATPNGLFTFAPGSHTITATYSGDASFNTSTSTASSFTITKDATSTTSTSTGQTLAATVTTSSGGTPPSGTVTFSVGGAQVGSPVTVTGVAAVIDPQSDAVITGAQATATLSLSPVPSGSFKAVYNGDANYSASTSPTTGDFTLGSSVATLTIPNPGAAGNLTLTVTAVNGFAGTIQFSSASCSGLPSGSSCSFSPASVAGGGTTTVTVSTTASKAAMTTPNRRLPRWWLATGGTSLAAICLLGVPVKRRRWNALLSLVVASLVLYPGCGGGGGGGGGGGNSGTPAGSYTVVVSGTSGSLTHTTSFTLTVQ